MKYFGSLVLGALLLGLLAACGGGATPAATPTTRPATSIATPTKAPTASAPKPGDANKGKQLVTDKGCIACHTIQNVSGAVGTIGPDLSHLASKTTIVADVNLPLNQDNLKKWLKNPPGVKAATVMPNLSLSDQEISDLTAFLLTLK